MKETMKAVVLTGHGGLDKLIFHRDWPKPAVRSNEVRIRVQACGLNNTDVNTRTGWYSKSVKGATSEDASDDADAKDAAWGGSTLKFPRIQGADTVGIVTDTGPDADSSLLGARVIVDGWLRDWNDPMNLDKCGYFGSECNGGFAEFATVDHRNVHPVKSALSSAELATFSTSYNTAENMLSRANVTEDDTVLVTGASGGVGSALIQLARRRGARVVAMCSAGKAEQVAAIAPDAVIPRTPANIQAALLEAADIETVTVVADIVGGPSFPGLIEALARGGRYACAGAIAGPTVDLDLRDLYLRDLSFFGCTVPSINNFAKIVRYVEQADIKPLMAAVFPLEQLREAQKLFIEKKHVGNIVVEV